MNKTAEVLARRSPSASLQKTAELLKTAKRWLPDGDLDRLTKAAKTKTRRRI